MAPQSENVRQMHKDDLLALLEDAAERGAKRALASVGLHDDGASEDIKDLRGILDNFRVIKKSMLQQLGRAITTVILTAIVVAAGLHWSNK